MQFLKTLFWVVLAVVLVLFARENWVPVTINLWSGIQADVKLPILVAFAFLLGWLPMYLLYRGRLWTLRRRFTAPDRIAVANQPSAPEPVPAPDLVKSEPSPAA